ncbi:Cloroperoxidase [Backusella circina FSU 941]|nr:Cloroperoxidase [Backusella circina FSU 941]
MKGGLKNQDGVKRLPSKRVLSLLLGLVVLLAVIYVFILEIQAKNMLKTPEEWKELMKQHPHQRRESDLRSPCPVVNTLANHGFISRDGRQVKYNDLYNAAIQLGLSPLALISVLKVAYNGLNEPKPGDHFVRQFIQPNTLDLDRLGVFSVLEHDVSLTRQDLQVAPHSFSYPLPKYIHRMLKMAKDGTFTAQNEHDARKLRWLESVRDNRDIHLPLAAQFASATECFLLMNVVGREGKLRASHLESILLNETFPEDWYPRQTMITPSELINIFKCWSGVRSSQADLSLLDSLD